VDERIAQELKERYQILESKGELLSQEQLARYFSTFRAKFGPDRLINLSDEALLDIVYNFENRGSLVYWLEFKNDDEFPSVRFGSIAGGSAFKYGLFRKKETGVWTTGSPQKPESLTEEQAIELARRHRSQLIKGADFWIICLNRQQRLTTMGCNRKWIA
jgi:5-methylcytosine-specific restriction protein B